LGGAVCGVEGGRATTKVDDDHNSFFKPLTIEQFLFIHRVAVGTRTGAANAISIDEGKKPRQYESYPFEGTNECRMGSVGAGLITRRRPAR